MITAIVLCTIILLLSQFLPRLYKGIPMVAGIQGTMLILSLITIAIMSKGAFSVYGFRKPENIPWLRFILTAITLGAVFTLLMLVLRTGGHPAGGKLTFLQTVLFIWILASISEEVLTRGLVQSIMGPLASIRIRLILFNVGLPTLISAILFSAMHIVVFFSGATVSATIVIMVFALFVGLLAGHARDTSDSVYPAIVVHMFANMGGLLGGIIYGSLMFMITGQPPG